MPNLDTPSIPLTWDQWRAVADAISYKITAAPDAGLTEEETAVIKDLEAAFNLIEKFLELEPF